MNPIEEAVEYWCAKQQGTAGDIQKLINAIEKVAVLKSVIKQEIDGLDIDTAKKNILKKSIIGETCD